MPQRVLELISFFELKVILPIGFLAGVLPNYEFDWSRIFVTLVATIVSGVAWVFLKPLVLKWRDKVYSKSKDDE